MSTWTARAARRAVVRWCRIERQIYRATNRVTRALAGLAWATSKPAERTSLGLMLHDTFEHVTTLAEAGLFDWEERWFERSLPPAPSRILVGAAGSGREALALLERGYLVDAFEPATRAYEALHANVARRGRTWRLSYQQLARRGEGEPGPVGTYDAVLLGWGSLACVLEDVEREALVQACDALCPAGPILASFVARKGLMRHGLGRAGRAAARLLGTSVPEGVVMLANAGFIRPLERSDAEALGAAIGRSTKWEEPGFAHVTWRPPATPA